MNKWGIPSSLELEVRKRDKNCVYCGVKFCDKNKSRKSIATWEHIINNAKIININNIALCCCSCNASKGAKELLLWIKSDYCIKNNITPDNVASVVKKVLILKS